ncbi:YhgE/Pip domain-containing protein [Bacillus sp. FJAT-52991]|uniref:ABC transporter permease n=1 Tax=Bacillus kandeliae TaxID=3129297 RepID=A0ABZ2N933_9BACI
MSALKNFFQVRETYIGLLAAVAFQVIFFCVWMTAYDGVDDRVGNLKIGIVNDDLVIGEEVTTQMKKNSPFTIKEYQEVEKAKADMEDRKLNMVIHLPAKLTEKVKVGQEVEVVYWINGANAGMGKTMMEGAAHQMTGAVNSHLFVAQKEGMLKQFIPANGTPEAVGDAISQMVGNLNDQLVQPKIKKVNEVKEFAASMVPMMVILASFVGAMVMTMQLQQTADKIKGYYGKWEVFAARQVINIGFSFFLTFITLALMMMFDIQSESSMLVIYLFQSLLFFSFLSLAQMFVYLMGNAGMVFNIIALSLQLVTSGVIVPREMLSDFYSNLGSYLPATYGSDGYFTIIFGGEMSHITSNMQSLLLISLGTMAVTVGAVLLKGIRSKEVVIEKAS